MRGLGSSPGVERGVTLVEVLVSILVLSFGILGLSATFAYGVQAPKLSAYRSTAVNIAAAHIDKIRANVAGFQDGNYEKPISYDGSFDALSPSSCVYPTCGPASLADMDASETSALARRELPAGGMLLTCDPSPCGPNSMGNLWVIWQEPQSLAALRPASDDHCPEVVTSTYTSPSPRCLYVRFKP